MSNADDVYKYTYSKIKYLNSIEESGEGKKTIAELRRGVGKKPGEIPTLWGAIFDGIDEDLLGISEPSYAEWAIYIALTLYALHSQGFSGCAHVDNISLGSATAELVKEDDDIERILKHLNLVVTANSLNDLSYQLRSVITMLRSDEISLDYARLAKELYCLQFSDVSYKIKLQWGRDFYKKINKDKKGDVKDGQ